MDTGAHIVCNLLVQSRPSQPQIFAAIIIGAALPDLPIVFFYAWESLVIGNTEAVIWDTRYFLPSWQNFIDCFNSIPIIALVLLVSVLLQLKWLSVIMIGMLLHIMFDLPLHHDDAHHHLFPFSDWRFLSPVSYWDPRYHGDLIKIIQIVLVAVGLVWLWIRHPGTMEKLVTVAIGMGYVVFQIFVLQVWNN